MKWIPKYQKAGKLNFKTTGLPWQQSKEDQEVARHAQSVGILNPTNLKSRLQPASKNLKAKYNNLSTKERLALAKKSMPHSEIVTVKDQQGNTKTDTNPQAAAMPGTEAQTVFRPSQTGGSLEFDGKTWNSIYEYPSTIEKNTKTPVVVPEDASFLYSGKNGLYSVYKLPSRMATSKVNEINGFIVRTPAVRDMSYEMQVLEPSAPVQYADEFNWLTKSKPKLTEDKDGFPFIEYKGEKSSGLASGSEQGVVRGLYRDQYSQLLKEAEEQNQGLLYSKPNTILRREHNNYPYYALPNWNLKNAKHILPYDLRIPRNWSDPNIFRIAAPIGMSLPFLNNSQK